MISKSRTALVTRRHTLRALGALAVTGTLGACAARPDAVSKAAADPALLQDPTPSAATLARYQQMQDHGYTIVAVEPGYLTGSNPRALIYYEGSEPVGSIVVDPYARRLYLPIGHGLAVRYGCAVGKQGTTFSGNGVISRKVEWPNWAPTLNMIHTEPEVYTDYAQGVLGGPQNPLGARALYLYRDGKDTYYRIHGTNNPSTIGRATSAGCIRLFDQDVINLYKRVPLGTDVHVRTPEESAAMVGPLQAGYRGYVIPVHDPEVVIHGPEANAILDTSAPGNDPAIAAAAAQIASEPRPAKASA
jgi:lipoprotein-anchoring transpeptidase ErfK/SrfK